MNKKTVLFIINPVSGTSRKNNIPNIIATSLNTDLFNYDIIFTERQGHACELSMAAAQQGVDIVAAVGGDGTVNEVARGIVNTSAALALLPCGSGNGLARHLMIPMNMTRAIELINMHEIHALDYGVISDHPFFCTCGMGFDAYVSMKFAESATRGPITYVENVLRQGLAYKPETYEIEIEGDSLRRKAFLISVANASQYGNNAYIAPQASMSDGYLDVIIMEPFDLLEASQISIDMFNKTLDKNSKIKTFKCRQLHIHRSKPGLIHYDGEPVMAGTEIDVVLHGKGIRVVVNPHANKRLRQPNIFQSAAADLFNEINVILSDINKEGRHIMALNKLMQKKIKQLNR